jgi:Ca-activated chloride channel family protein
MSFGSPLALLGLLAVPIAVVALLLLSRRRAKNGLHFSNLDVLSAVVPSRRRSLRRALPAALLVAALATGAAAASNPRARMPLRVDNATIILLVDVSGSMSARDVEPTRLDAAVAAMRTFLQRLPGGIKVGLVQFSDSAQVLLAPTADHQQVSERLDLLEPDSGTAIGSGIVGAIGLVRVTLAHEDVVRKPGKDLPAAIVLLSDGNQNQGVIGPIAAAKRARARGIVIDTVALGTPHGILGYGPFAPRVAPDPPLMHAIARVTGGTTATARDPRQLTRFYQHVGTSFGRTDGMRNIASWFAAAAAVLLLGAVVLGRAFAGALA